MIRIVVLYPQSDGNWFNMEYYKKNHIPLAKKLLEPFGLKKFELDAGLTGINGPAPYFAIATLTFDTPEQFQKGFAECGKALTDDMPNYTKDFILQVGEIVDI
jgi:uncharacterized protein (TIGR02118 family)